MHRKGDFTMHSKPIPRHSGALPAPQSWPAPLALEWRRRVTVLTTQFSINPPEAEARARQQLEPMARRWR